VGGEAEVAGPGGWYRGGVSDRQYFQKVILEQGQVIADSERKEAGWGHGKTEASQALLSAGEIVDANDEVIDEAAHGISGAASRTVTRAATAAQSMVYDVELKKIYCKAAPYP